MGSLRRCRLFCLFGPFDTLLYELFMALQISLLVSRNRPGIVGAQAPGTFGMNVDAVDKNTSTALYFRAVPAAIKSHLKSHPNARGNANVNSK